MSYSAETFYMTDKQIQIMQTILKGDGKGGWIDMDQLLDRLPYQTSKQSMQFSIRALIKHGMVEKKGTELRRGRRRVCYSLTPLGYKVVGG